MSASEPCSHSRPLLCRPQEPLRSIYFGTGVTQGAVSPACHDHTDAADSLDLLVGLSTGDGAILLSYV